MQTLLKNKNIILAISGGIAAYKTPILVRELIKQGANVRVVMTEAAKQFVTKLALETVSNYPVIDDVFNLPVNLKTWHIEYSEWADLIIFAPATVNTINKIASGIADNPVTILACAARKKMLFVPAADMYMYNNPIFQENLIKLETLGHYVLPAEEGFLASGLSGIGRMPEIDKIIDATKIFIMNYQKDLCDKKILVTAGPTYEDIDPVRYIGNRSSGKMGYEIAKAAYLRGANVTLITGPTSLNIYPEIKRINVRSAIKMKESIINHIQNHDVLIMAAAVADFRPVNVSDKKIKKDNNFNFIIELEENPDILFEINKFTEENNIKIKKIGFALETDDELNNAKKKLNKKNLDMIVLNSLNDKNSGFEFDTNSITIIRKNSDVIEKFPLSLKFDIANIILSKIYE